jgi:hypothetical protein
MFADIARRGLSHPNAVAYVKRGLTARSENVEVPGWGLVLLYLSFWVAAVSIYLVRRAHHHHHLCPLGVRMQS